MNRKLFLFIPFLTLLLFFLSTHAAGQNPTAVAAGTLTSYYTLMGYEGIGTLGQHLTDHGATPPVGDYVTTHCRYINVTNTILGDYYLRYPLHLPNGANITQVSLFLADYNPSGILATSLRSHPWDSHGDHTWGYVNTDDLTNSDKMISMTGLNVNVDNLTTNYWIDVTPENSAAPGQLCVYSIRVTYTIDGVFLPLLQRGY